MNVICLLGRLTTDPELRRTQTDTAVTSFSVAVDRAFQPKDSEQRQADFINCVAWRQTAEFICRYFHKGQRIALQGSLQSRGYTDKDGNQRTAFEVVIDHAYFAETKESKAQEATGYVAPQLGFSTAGPNDFEEIAGDESDSLPF